MLGVYIMFRDLDAQLFSPLSKEYCMYFYALTVMSFALLALSIGSSVYYLVEGKVDVFSAVMSLTGPALLYFNNRLLYSMCVH